MSCKRRFKFDPEDYPMLTRAMLLLDVWWNPFGNWHEPLPFPEKRRLEAPSGAWAAWRYWHWRNLLHNCTHFVIGIVPIGDRYEWISPECAGWRRIKGSRYSVWVKRWRVPLPYLFGTVGAFEWSIGWKSDGCWGVNFRKKQA